MLDTGKVITGKDWEALEGVYLEHYGLHSLELGIDTYSLDTTSQSVTDPLFITVVETALCGSKPPRTVEGLLHLMAKNISNRSDTTYEGLRTEQYLYTEQALAQDLHELTEAMGDETMINKSYDPFAHGMRSARRELPVISESEVTRTAYLVTMWRLQTGF